IGMTAVTQITFPATPAISEWRSKITRNELFAALYILGCTNGLLGRVIQSLHFEGTAGAILGFDINAIVLLACVVGIGAVFSARQENVRSFDWAVAGIFVILVSLPIFPLSW